MRIGSVNGELTDAAETAKGFAIAMRLRREGDHPHTPDSLPPPCCSPVCLCEGPAHSRFEGGPLS